MIFDERDMSETIEQCDSDGEEGAWRRPRWHDDACGYCLKPVDLTDAFVEIISDHEFSVSYPDERLGTRCVLTHRDCGPGSGYMIPLAELAGGGDESQGPLSYNGWLAHLRMKRWFTATVHAGLEFASQLARRLRTQVRAEAKAAQNRVDALRIVRIAKPANANPRSISAGTKTRVMERDNFTCRRCGHTAPDVRLVVDHIVPVAKGGTADENNLQTLCFGCNAGKRDRAPHSHDLRDREIRE